MSIVEWRRVRDGFGGYEHRAKTKTHAAVISKTGSRLETDRWGWTVYDRSARIVAKGTSSTVDRAKEYAQKALGS